jgi:hypothetical protein
MVDYICISPSDDFPTVVILVTGRVLGGLVKEEESQLR